MQPQSSTVVVHKPTNGNENYSPLMAGFPLLTESGTGTPMFKYLYEARWWMVSKDPRGKPAFYTTIPFAGKFDFAVNLGYRGSDRMDGRYEDPTWAYCSEVSIRREKGFHPEFYQHIPFVLFTEESERVTYIEKGKKKGTVRLIDHNPYLPEGYDLPLTAIIGLYRIVTEVTVKHVG